MCGITGLLLHGRGDPDPAAALAAIAPMTERLRHRGPSDAGLWRDTAAGVALGHRRLSIVDLSPAAHQPMASASGRFVVSFNGEIYNFRDLRSALEARGAVFRGSGDTEVLLAAVEAWGITAALARFAGMFAIALWDRQDRVLHLARDRFGKKPLYVAELDHGFAFASEPKAFQSAPGFAPTLDPAGLAAFLRQGWIGDRDCIWAEAMKLPPGCSLAIRAGETGDLAALRGRVTPWWRLADVVATGAADPCTRPVPEVVEELDGLLRRAVSQRMIADVPLGAFLSGGVDSALVVALMGQVSGRAVKTYTIGFGESQFDEADRAEAVAAHLGADHTTFRVTAAEARAVIPELPDVWDEPFADDSQIPMLLLARLARQDVTVALSGDGGDEAFGGYARHFLYDRLSPLLRLHPALRRTAAGCLLAASPAGWDGMLGAAPMPAAWRRALRRDKIHKFADLLAADGPQAWYDRATTFGGGAARSAVADHPMPRFTAPITDILYRDATQYLPGDVLVKVDRATMAAGLEARAPLLDHRVVDFAWHLPLDLKLRNRQGKWILRQVLRRYVPDALMGPKSGFDVPVGAWLRGPLRPWAEARIDDLLARDHPALDPHAIRLAWASHLDGRQDRSREVWALTMLSAWLQRWVPSTPAPVGAEPPGRWSVWPPGPPPQPANPRLASATLPMPETSVSTIQQGHA